MTAPPSIPATCADCISTLKTAGANIQQQPIQWMRSADGKMRMDLPNMSVINDPTQGRKITLDHLNKTFQISPLQPPGVPGMPGFPNVPNAALPDVSKFQDLGRAMIEGVEVLGKRYQFDMPTGPAVTDIWSGVQTNLPVLTKTTGAFGEQICHCKFTPGEPPAATFQIPPGYAEVQPPAVAAAKPAVPAAPAVPAVPTIPKLR